MAYVETERELEAGDGRRKQARHVGRWRHFRTILKDSWLAKVGVAIVVSVLFLTAFGPLVAPYSATEASPAVFEAPSASHWFGTDGGGLDVFSRVLVAP